MLDTSAWTFVPTLLSELTALLEAVRHAPPPSSELDTPKALASGLTVGWTRRRNGLALRVSRFGVIKKKKGGERSLLRLPAPLALELQSKPHAHEDAPRAIMGLFEMSIDDWESERTPFGEVAALWVSQSDEERKASAARLAEAMGLNKSKSAHLERAKFALRLLSGLLFMTHLGGKKLTFQGLVGAGRLIRLEAPHPEGGRRRTAPVGHHGGTWRTATVHPELLKLICGGTSRFAPIPKAALGGIGRDAAVATAIYRRRALSKRARATNTITSKTEGLLAELGMTHMTKPLDALETTFDRLVGCGVLRSWRWVSGERSRVVLELVDPEVGSNAPILSSDALKRADRVLEGPSNATIPSGDPSMGQSPWAHEGHGSHTVDPSRSRVGGLSPPPDGGSSPSERV